MPVGIEELDTAMDKLQELATEPLQGVQPAELLIAAAVVEIARDVRALRELVRQIGEKQ